MEAYFAGNAYGMHRHDTYAIGLTLGGVQRFHYRGTVADGLPGTAIVLHPDEPHDGGAGTEAGFHYRMAYLEPSRIQAALGGKSLPFISGGVSSDARLVAAVRGLLRDLASPMERLEYDDAVFEVAHALDVAAGKTRRPRLLDYRSAERARAMLDASLDNAPISLAEIEREVGRDRWSITRDFRRAFGASPHRYVVMRRLGRAKAALESGKSLADAAASAGFADQAHMTRHFHRAFGLTPARWRRLMR